MRWCGSGWRIGKNVSVRSVRLPGSSKSNPETVAKWMATKPKILIVDEPLVGLDPRSARIVKDLFLAQARSGVAVLMSTHLLSIAEELADTIGIVNHGRMLAHGTLAELRTKLQSDASLEDLFLALTGGDRPNLVGRNATSRVETVQ